MTTPKQKSHFRSGTASRNQKNLQRLIGINQRLIRWLECKFSEGLETLGKEADQRAIDWVMGAKSSLLATLVTLSNLSIALEKSPAGAKEEKEPDEPLPFSEGDVALVKRFLDRGAHE